EKWLTSVGFYIFIFLWLINRLCNVFNNFVQKQRCIV
ncbi:MAG: hypothetical protein ACI8XG_002251, partial [Congregibacter sp.]